MPTPGGSLTRVGAASPIDGQIEQLQTELERERDARMEERFWLLAVCGLLGDMLAFQNAGIAAGSFYSLIYLVFLIVYSKKCGVEGVQEAVSWASGIIRSIRSDDDKSDKTDE